MTSLEHRLRITWRCVLFGSALMLTSAVGQAGTYYVTTNGTGNGSAWDNSFGSIQAALNAISNSIDTDATVFVAKTASPTYSSAVKVFGTSLTVRLYGGYNTNTSLRDGVSEIAFSGATNALEIGTVGVSPVTNVGTFVVSDFKLNTGGIGLRSSKDATTFNYSYFIVSNSTITTTSAAFSAVSLGASTYFN